MGLPVALFPGEQPQYGLHTVTTLQPSGGETVGAVRNAGIILSVGCQTHNIKPLKTTQLRQIAPVKIRVLGTNFSNTKVREPLL